MIRSYALDTTYSGEGHYGLILNEGICNVAYREDALIYGEFFWGGIM